MSKQFVAFKVANVLYCIDIMDVQEVVRADKVTVMPNLPSFVEGVLNQRGKIIPILSIQKRLFPDYTLKIQQFSYYKIIIVKINDVSIGLLVDMVDKILEISDEELQNLHISQNNTTIIEGSFHKDKEEFTIINVADILEAEESLFLHTIKKQK